MMLSYVRAGCSGAAAGSRTLRGWALINRGIPRHGASMILISWCSADLLGLATTNEAGAMGVSRRLRLPDQRPGCHWIWWLIRACPRTMRLTGHGRVILIGAEVSPGVPASAARKDRALLTTLPGLVGFLDIRQHFRFLIDFLPRFL